MKTTVTTYNLYFGLSMFLLRPDNRHASSGTATKPSIVIICGDDIG